MDEAQSPERSPSVAGRMAASGTATAPGRDREVAEGESGPIDTRSGRAVGRTECGDDSFFSTHFDIQLLCQNLDFGTTGNTWKNNA
jgi:hypothetical protein